MLICFFSGLPSGWGFGCGCGWGSGSGSGVGWGYGGGSRRIGVLNQFRSEENFAWKALSKRSPTFSMLANDIKLIVIRNYWTIVSRAHVGCLELSYSTNKVFRKRKLPYQKCEGIVHGGRGGIWTLDPQLRRLVLSAAQTRDYGLGIRTELLAHA